LTGDQVTTLKGALHREVIVRSRPATTKSLPDGRPLPAGLTVLEVLDTEQEQAARSLGEGHQLVFGVAGSGKTLLLLARARLLADRDPSAKVLILCFNKVLAASLAAKVCDLPAIEVRTFHSWAAGKTGQRWRDDESFEAYESRLVASLLGGMGHFAESEKYDAILIDEGHDFEPDWFRCAVGMLRHGTEGNLLIAGDAAQSLYGRDSTFTWKSVGVQASGRSRRLSRNYRNTKQILESAWRVTQSHADNAETESNVRVLPTKASRQGAMPIYRGCVTFAQERDFIIKQVDELKAGGLEEREIAVLYPRRDGRRIEDLCRRLRESFEVSWISNPEDSGDASRSIFRPGVRLMTIHSAKGLEFPAVIASCLDLLPNSFEPDEQRDGNLLYVGLTRAIDHLVATWTGRSVFTDRIKGSSKAVLVEG
jgi:superfamily I DNA/RNA helicase